MTDITTLAADQVPLPPAAAEVIDKTFWSLAGAASSSTRLKTLDEYNRERWPNAAITYPHRNGITCPKCGEELCDMDDRVLTSYPPKRNVGCLDCGLRDYRIA